VTEKVSTVFVRRRIEVLLNRVSLRGDEFLIVRRGKTLAALVPVARFEQMQLWTRAEALRPLDAGQGTHLSESKAMALANRARAWSRRRGRKGTKAGPPA
jgi:antitoxin (DNA-binding transcriptional repressor) of toxin-antitoxin stability system